MKQILLLLGLLLIGSYSNAEGSAGTLSIDNDLFTFRDSDRDYSGGARYTSASRGGRTWQAGLVLFTPSDVESRMFERGERPYASLVYYARSNITSTSPTTLTRRTWSVGIMGSQLGEAAQRFIHEHTSSPEPRGYDNQISEGGELTGRFGAAQYRHLFSVPTRAGHLTVVSETSGSLGYVTDATYGIGFRLHTRRQGWWGDVRHDFLTHLDEPEAVDHFEGFFGGARIRTRVYNAMLQGQFRHSQVTFKTNELNRVIAEVWLGTATSIKGWQLKYTMRFTTSEVKHGRAARSHVWGAMVVRRRV